MGVNHQWMGPMTTKADRLLGAPERRGFKCDEFEVRSSGADTATLTGYASMFDKGYEMYGGPDKGGWTEIVDTRAFDETLKRKPDVHLLLNHDGMPLARTKAGTLHLSTDRVGLNVVAELDTSRNDVSDIVKAMQSGALDEMSFAFRTVRQEWNTDETERRMLELNLDKGDVSVVNFGANPHTSVGVRSALAAISSGDLSELRSLDPDDVLAAHTILGRLLDPSSDDEEVIEELSVKPSGMSVAHARRLLALDA